MSTRTSKGAEYLRRYFHSGWAFLIPYLAAYLLYYWLEWPVNAGSSEGTVKVASESDMWVPCLLHVYWILHATNAILAVIALVSWWKEKGAKKASTTNAHESTRMGSSPLSQLPPIRSAREGGGSSENEAWSPSPSLSLSLKIAPWLLLALLFYIPGVYLEYPADPWDHYARINEWSSIHTVGEHTVWTKSSYFLAYSLLGQIAPPTRQLFWLDFYYTGCCLLLCWHYYRLARAVGFGERASFIFVLVQAFTFGNNIFGFYRYYGISSSIFAQLGAVALVRLAIEYANQKFQVPRFKFHEAATGILQEETEAAEGIATAQLGTPTAHEGIACEQAQPALSYKLKALSSARRAVRFPGFPLPRFSAVRLLVSGFWPLAAVFCLLAMTAFNHPQGVGIAGLGLLAVAVWRMIEWKRSMIFWLAAAAIVLSVATVLWWPRNPALDVAYRPAGWLTAWYGFNLFSPSSLAFDRTMAILGLFGIVNLLAGSFLLRRNHVVAWLMITPLLVLSLPVVAIPFAGALAGRSLDEVLTFHRMLLAVPTGMAIVCLAAEIANRKIPVSGLKRQGSAPLSSFRPVKTDMPVAHEEIAPKQAPPALGFELKASSPAARRAFPFFRFPGFRAAFPLVLLSLAALLVVPTIRPFYNRFWQVLMVPPGDLMMKPIVLAADSVTVRLRDVRHVRLATTPSIAYILGAISPRNFPYTGRSIGQSVVEPLNSAIATALSSLPTFNHQCPMLTRDPSAADSLAWTALAGSPPQFVTAIRDFPASSTALQNPPGQCSEVFTADLIKVDPAKNYQVEFSARQLIGTNATAYLAIAWYNEGRRLLESNIPAPAGAGTPVDWDNGTYSYFGLVGESPPATWTIFRKSFGLGETAAIPRSAKFVRVGALLNYNSTPAATIQLTNVRLWQKSVSEFAGEAAFRSDQLSLSVVPSSQMVWTSASQAAQTSHHWPAQEVAVDLAGGAELAAAARAASGMPVDPENAVFELGGKAPASNH